MFNSWEKSSKWYGKVVGERGHYYHQQVILPTVIKLLNLKPKDKLLDVGCGQGVLARAISRDIEYVGIDISPSMIKQANRFGTGLNRQFLVADYEREQTIYNGSFSHAAMVMSLQNMERIEMVINNIAKALINKGVLVIAINHPCFRIPRQSGWEVDQNNKLQKRWVSRYMTKMKIPITMHPSSRLSEITMTYHHPLSFYVKLLKHVGFVISDMEEIVSIKKSNGKLARMENRGREEIPLFLMIGAIKGIF